MPVLIRSLHVHSSERLILYRSLPFCSTCEIYSIHEKRLILWVVQIASANFGVAANCHPFFANIFVRYA